jgi:quercetin dioxygenase-like cupin family protein
VIALRMALAALQSALAEVPQNSHAWTYTIRGLDSTDYLTRTLLPRIAGHRLMLHRIHRPDADRHLHNHPWRTARFLIVSGGYVEERLVGDRVERRILKPGDVNHLDAQTFHRVDTVWPGTFTVGLIGERCQDWGFLIDGALVPHADYFASKNYRAVAPGLS